MEPRRLNVTLWLKDNWLEIALVAVFQFALIWLTAVGSDLWQRVRPEPSPTPIPTTSAGDASPAVFDGQDALGVAAFFTALGPRVAGSEAHQVAAERIEQALADSGWQVAVHDFQQDGQARRNIMAMAGEGAAILLAAHYDTSPAADRDPVEANRLAPPPGANDGASGPAVLLELARTLDREQLNGQVWLAFVDGHYSAQGAPDARGMQELATRFSSETAVNAAVVLDLVGGDEARFALDPATDPALSGQLWDIADDLGYDAWFLSQPGSSVDLGQESLADLGIPTAVIADPGYTSWRTLQDTTDKLSPQSLERVGRVLQAFVASQQR